MLSIWWRDRKRQQTYHRASLFMMKWILGYAKEFKTLASKMITKFEKIRDGEEGQSDKNN